MESKLKRNQVKSKIEETSSYQREARYRLKFAFFLSRANSVESICDQKCGSPLDRALLFSPPFTSLSFFEPTNPIQNVNVEILDRFHRTSCILVTTSLPLIRFNQFGLFFSLSSEKRYLSIVAFYKAVIGGMPLIFQFQFLSCNTFFTFPLYLSRVFEILIEIYFNCRSI